MKDAIFEKVRIVCMNDSNGKLHFNLIKIKYQCCYYYFCRICVTTAFSLAFKKKDSCFVWILI